MVQMSRQHAVELNCRCASQRVPWRPCISNANLIGKEEGLVDVMHLENDDAFALVKCGANEKLARGFDVHHRSLLVPPPAMRTAEGGASRMGGDSPPPDVLVIEIDSLSRAAARRHLPQLMQLLETHPRLREQYVDVEFKLLGVTGSNSIPNQAALLGGCTAVFGNDASQLHDGTLLHDGEQLIPAGRQSMMASGFRLWWPQSNTTKNASPPWLFATAKDLGYTTFFGEEMCAAGELNAPLPFHTVCVCPMCQILSPQLTACGASQLFSQDRRGPSTHSSKVPGLAIPSTTASMPSIVGLQSKCRGTLGPPTFPSRRPRPLEG